MPLESQSKSETAPEEASSTENRMLELRSRISDLGFELDAEKAGLG